MTFQIFPSKKLIIIYRIYTDVYRKNADTASSAEAQRGFSLMDNICIEKRN